MQGEDELWPRAANWLKPSTQNCDLGVFGVPAHLTSISPTGANQTPAAIRAALTRYSLNSSAGNLAELIAHDFGDVAEPDSPAGELRTTELAELVLSKSKLAVALGGDNSITFAVAKATLASGGSLITLDAHHDIRSGISNGSPVRRLIEEFGLPGNRIVQIGINDFSNSFEYSKLAKEYGINVITRAEVSELGVQGAVDKALAMLGDENIHIDFDVDVCDRSFVPATPASAPGGISAFELRQFARLLCRDNRVRSIDITEIDATRDSEDQRTVRLGALLILEAAAGLLSR
ncbi:MAG: agmatinase family protein [Acidobacteria bacterium]|nr:agmatinase family protein [Acidobacteriota bacterium]